MNVAVEAKGPGRAGATKQESTRGEAAALAFRYWWRL